MQSAEDTVGSAKSSDDKKSTTPALYAPAKRPGPGGPDARTRSPLRKEGLASAKSPRYAPSAARYHSPRRRACDGRCLLWAAVSWAVGVTRRLGAVLALSLLNCGGASLAPKMSHHCPCIVLSLERPRLETLQSNFGNARSHILQVQRHI